MMNNRLEELKLEALYYAKHFSEEESYRLEMTFAEYLQVKAFLNSDPTGRNYYLAEGFHPSNRATKPYYLKQK